MTGERCELAGIWSLAPVDGPTNRLQKVLYALSYDSDETAGEPACD